MATEAAFDASNAVSGRSVIVPPSECVEVNTMQVGRGGSNLDRTEVCEAIMHQVPRHRDWLLERGCVQADCASMCAWPAYDIINHFCVICKHQSIVPAGLDKLDSISIRQ